MTVRAEAVRWVDDEPWPGLVEVALTDPGGSRTAVIDLLPWALATRLFEVPVEHLEAGASDASA